MDGHRANDTVIIIGGGLAGMVAGLELLRLGVDVELYEARERLGGKAGADARPPLYDRDYRLLPDAALPDGVQSDHGYHVFPVWYTNMRRLWRDIGIDDGDVYQGSVYLDLPPAVDGDRQPFAAEASADLRQLMAICDLVLQPDHVVEGLTLQAFLHSRPYARRDAPISLNDFILNALTIGDADISSRVVRDVFRQWLPVFGQPNWDALRGSLGDVLIDRLEARMHEVAALSGARLAIHRRHRLTALALDGGYTMKLTIEDDSGTAHTVTDCPVILALPPQVLRQLDSTELFVHDSGVSGLHYLRCNPFAALDVFFDRELPGMEDEHFTLAGSPWGITGFDISRHWPRLEFRRRTVLQFVAADSRRFAGLDDAGFVRVMAEEIARFIPEVRDAVEYFVPHRNGDDPLFVNDVGSWHFRPETRSQLPNLYFAGDYVRSETAVTSMEAAVRSGLMAAEALRADRMPGTEPVVIEPVVPLPEALRELIEEVHPDDPLLALTQCMQWFRETAVPTS